MKSKQLCIKSWSFSTATSNLLSWSLLEINETPGISESSVVIHVLCKELCAIIPLPQNDKWLFLNSEQSPPSLQEKNAMSPDKLVCLLLSVMVNSVT